MKKGLTILFFLLLLPVTFSYGKADDKSYILGQLTLFQIGPQKKEIVFTIEKKNNHYALHKTDSQKKHTTVIIQAEARAIQKRFRYYLWKFSDSRKGCRPFAIFNLPKEKDQSTICINDQVATLKIQPLINQLNGKHVAQLKVK